LTGFFVDMPIIKENSSLLPQPGHLYVVATPIGNLADITERAKAILQRVDIIACEDTRTTGGLLSRLELSHKALSAYHDHNEIVAAEKLAEELLSGKSVAIVSDAGTPAISDPGFRLVRACRRKSIPVIPVPGANAIAAAVCASGLPTNGFLFVGFLPPKSTARITFFKKHRAFDYTIVLYESCHRIEKAVAEIVVTLGDQRVIALAKEITKLHEKFLVGPAFEVQAQLSTMSRKGEFVLMIAPESYVI
jgi:16S rRNA (cytidine1402-2'-O)-methyltransferase